MNGKRWIVALSFVGLLVGCGDDDSGRTSPTPIPSIAAPATPAIGPQVTFVGITRADDVLVQASETSPDGVPIYTRAAGVTGGGSGFRLVVEAKRGISGLPVALSTLNDNPNLLPDLQIQTNRPLGNGSTTVCDTAQPATEATPGGVPAIDPPSFEISNAHANSINDLACRFRDGLGQPMGIQSSFDGCVKIEPTEDYGFAAEDSEVQFCGFVSAILSFPRGDTLLTLRVRDEAGNVGVPARMVIRIQ